ncbi:hypothetical protein FO519_009512 [Halicephalobus sp. NKZ332]|nr:hypothetical protein FO519_009512 [Halicephalobus sp. NKZ332]
MVILKQITVLYSKGAKNKFEDRWLIINHETKGPSMFIYKDHNAKKLVEERIDVSNAFGQIRFGTTCPRDPTFPLPRQDNRIDNANFIFISTEKVDKKNNKKSSTIWLCAQSTTELFQIIKLLSASMMACGFPAPTRNQEEDNVALHRYQAKPFRPSNEWEEYWDNPPKTVLSGSVMSVPNLIQAQPLTISADRIHEQTTAPRSHTMEPPAHKQMTQSYQVPPIEPVDSIYYDDLYPTREMASKPIPAPKSRRFEQAQPRSQPAAVPEYWPKRQAAPLVTSPRYDTSDSEIGKYIDSYKSPYKQSSPRSMKKLPSPRSSPESQYRPREYHKSPRSPSPDYERKTNSPVYAYVPVSERQKSESVHTSRTSPSIIFEIDNDKVYPIQRGSSKAPLQYDYPPDEKEIPVRIIKGDRRKPSSLGLPTPPSEPIHYETFPKRKSLVSLQHAEGKPTKTKPKPCKRLIGYLNAEVQTDHSIQGYPLIEYRRPDTPDSHRSFNEKVEKLRILTAPEATQSLTVDSISPPEITRPRNSPKPNERRQFSSALRTFSRENLSEDSSSPSSSSSSFSSSSSSSKGKRSTQRKRGSHGSYTLDKPMVVTTAVTHMSEPELVVEDDETRTYSIETRF